MANSNNTMLVTSPALTKVSKELINKRKYNPKLIEAKGEPVVIEGIASSLSEGSYFIKRKLDFSEATEVNVRISGVFSSKEERSTVSNCAFYLGAQDNLEKTTLVALELANNDVRLVQYIPAVLEDRIIYSMRTVSLFNTVELKDNDKVSIDVTFREGNVDTVLILNEEVLKSSREVSNLTIELFDLFAIGNNLKEVSNYWRGQLDLTKVVVSKDKKELYTPTIGNIFELSRVLVSDGLYPLTDNSVSILNHVYDCRVKEITRSNNNILLLVDFDSDVSLNIHEVGLYSTGSDGKQLFSLIQGLAINKSSNLDYSLILHVNLDMNVVNTTVLPKITLKKEENIKNKDFLIVKNTQAFMTTLLERMVKLNALGVGNYKPLDNIRLNKILRATKYPETIEAEAPRTMNDIKPVGVGYNKAQVGYRRQKEYGILKDCYNATVAYSNLKNRFSYKEKVVFDSESIDRGKNLVNTDGVASGFRNLNYVSKNLGVVVGAPFRFTSAFSTEARSGSTDETILCFASKAQYQPLRVYISNNRICASAGQLEKFVADGKDDLANLKRESFYRGSFSKKINDEDYYGWVYEGNSLAIEHTVYTKTVIPDKESKIYSISEDETVKEIPLVIKNTIAGVLFDKVLFPLEISQKTYLRIEFDREEYRFYKSRYGKSYELVGKLVTPVPINMIEQVLFGVNFDGEATHEPFYGKVYLGDTEFISDGVVDNFLKTEVVNVRELKDFYHIPKSGLNFCQIRNLNEQSKDYLITMEDSLIKGAYDNISLDSSKGFTLSIKTHLKDTSDKVILTKSIKEEDDYSRDFFTLLLLNSELVFTIFYDNSVVELRKKITVNDRSKFVENPITLTVVCSTSEGGNRYYLYRNGTLELSTTSIIKGEVRAKHGSLGNKMKLERIIKEDERETIEEYYLGGDENYVSDILYFNGELSEDDIYYICNALDTNF